MRRASMRSSSLGFARASLLLTGALSIAGSFAQAGPTLYGDAVVLPTSGQRGIPGQSPFGFPSVGSVGVDIDTDLSWAPANNAFFYDVYFGTDSTPDETEFLERVPASTLSYALDTLDWDTTYYWRIDTVGGFATIPGFVWFFTTEPQLLPDLNVTNVFVTTGGGDIRPGRFFNIRATVQNDGDAGALDLDFEFYASLDNIITADDILIANQFNAFDLPVGESDTHSRNMTLPESFPPGDYYFGAIVTESEGLDPDLSNNARAMSTTRTVLPPHYDLAATLCTYDASVSYSLGDTINVTSHVQNFGDFGTFDVNMEFYASTDSTITRDDIVLGEIDIQKILDPDGLWVVNDTPVLLIGDDEEDLLTPGTYYIGIYVRPQFAGDADIANNGLAGEFTITVLGPCAADLTGDGSLNFFDVSAFLTAFASEDPAADFTGDGAFNFFDVSAFLAAFAAGCP
jgi:hypothetical protein